MNYIQNSAGLNGMSDDWIYSGKVSTGTSTDISSNTSSNSCFILGSSSTLSQTVNGIVPDRSYTVSIRARKPYSAYTAYFYIQYNGIKRSIFLTPLIPLTGLIFQLYCPMFPTHQLPYVHTVVTHLCISLILCSQTEVLLVSGLLRQMRYTQMKLKSTAEELRFPTANQSRKPLLQIQSSPATTTTRRFSLSTRTKRKRRKQRLTES